MIKIILKLLLLEIINYNNKNKLNNNLDNTFNKNHNKKLLLKLFMFNKINKRNNYKFNQMLIISIMNHNNNKFNKQNNKFKNNNINHMIYLLMTIKILNHN